MPPLMQRGPAPRPRRRRHRRRPVLAVTVVVIAVAALAVAGVAVLRRSGPEPAAPAASASRSASPGSAAGASSPSASPSHAAGELPPRPHIVADPQPVPILVYHRVLEKPEGPPLTVMSTRLFRAQMAWLAENGYQPVTLRRVYDAWTGEGMLPPKPVVLTFDDGYADQVRNAAPVLREYGWPAELGLVSTALYLGDDPPATSLTPEMVQGLLDEGWGLESHSVDHLDLTRLWGEELRHELVDSRARSGGPVRRRGRLLLLPRWHLRQEGQARRPPRGVPRRDRHTLRRRHAAGSLLAGAHLRLRGRVHGRLRRAPGRDPRRRAGLTQRPEPCRTLDLS